MGKGNEAPGLNCRNKNERPLFDKNVEHKVSIEVDGDKKVHSGSTEGAWKSWSYTL